jgi:hypothetical protein
MTSLDPPLQGAHRLAGRCRDAGADHGPRIPGLAPQPLSQVERGALCPYWTAVQYGSINRSADNGRQICYRRFSYACVRERVLSTLTLTWSQVLIVALAAIGLYVVELVSFMRTARRHAEREKLTHERLEAMSAELAAMKETIETLASALDGMRRSPQSSGQYREAVEMAERGLDAAAVAENCGISRAEADLIVALYRSRAA